MKILVIGCGSIGERHIKNLKSISAGKIFAYDVDKNRLDLIKKEYNIDVYNSIENALNQKPEIVFVCTPPSSHIINSIEAVKNGAHIFIEKPMSNTIAGVKELLKIADNKNLLICVGYNFRFEKGLNYIKKLIDSGKIGRILSARAEFGQYLPDWRPWQDYTKSYTASKDLGGGIILDGSHEIDYMRWLLGEVDSVFCSAGKISDLNVETEDVAEIILNFKNGAICEIHLDFIRQGYTRNCEIIGKKGVIYWDFSEKTVKIYSSETKKWKIVEIKTDVNEMYIEEIKHFIKSIKDSKKPLVDGYEGMRSLQLALEIKKSSKNHKLIKIVS